MQFFIIYGILIRDLEQEALYRTIFSTSHKSRRIFQSIAGGKIIVAGEGIYKYLMQNWTYSLLLNMNVKRLDVLYSTNFNTSLAMQRQPINRSKRADIKYFRYRFEVGIPDFICRIPHFLNLGNTAIKSDSPLTQGLQLPMLSSRLSFKLTKLGETSTKQKLLGQVEGFLNLRKRKEYWTNFPHMAIIS